MLGTSVHSHLARAQVHFTKNTKQLSDGLGFGWKPKEHNPPDHRGGGATREAGPQSLFSNSGCTSLQALTC